MKKYLLSTIFKEDLPNFVDILCLRLNYCHNKRSTDHQTVLKPDLVRVWAG